MPLLKKLPIPPPKQRNNNQSSSQQKLKPGHKSGAPFHFHTETIGDRLFLKDGFGNIIKKVTINWNDTMDEKEKHQAIIDATRELRSYASDLFINFDGDSYQIGGFLFN